MEATQKLLSVFDINGTVVSEIEILPIWLTTGINAQIIHDCVVSELSNARQISGKTLTRGLVSGGGRKPWPQKKTGQARQGSNTSIQWEGGGVAFGPSGAQNYKYKLNKKVKQAGFWMLFLEKLRNNTLIILKELMYSKIATKNLLTLMKTFKVEQQRTLVLFESNSNEFTTIMLKSGRNIPNLTVSRLTELKHYDIVKAKSVIMTEAVWHQIIEKWGH